tara:strand:+ start:5789 stop:6817 length:1029 start_codon:yes stop_codon:yes gene_type:complete
MAEFFNKKEEMLEVQLTEYGKYLLSLGKLKPKYYAFYDDEILYNAAYAPSGADGSRISEVQNDIDRRIRFETPNMKVVPTRTGAETRVARFTNAVTSALGTWNSDPADNVEALHQQSFIETVNFSSYPIGTAELRANNTAAWRVNALRNTIASAKEFIITNPSSSFADINNGVITSIPQLNIDIDYQTFYREGDLLEDSISSYLEGASPNIYVALREDVLFLEIVEENTDSDKENFEIEVFYESSVTGSEGALSTLEQMEYLEPIVESEAAAQFASNLLRGPKPLGNTETNIGNVEYYFNLYLDNEIPFDIASVSTSASRAIAGSPQEFNRNLYRTEDEDAC